MVIEKCNVAARVFSFPRAVLISVTFAEAMLIGARMKHEHHSIKMLN